MNNASPLSRRTKFKKAWVGKGDEEKKKDDVVSLKGDLEKANEAFTKPQEAMGMAKKVMAQVNTPPLISKKGIHTPLNHTVGRIPQRTFT